MHWFLGSILKTKIIMKFVFGMPFQVFQTWNCMTCFSIRNVQNLKSCKKLFWSVRLRLLLNCTTLKVKIWISPMIAALIVWKQFLAKIMTHWLVIDPLGRWCCYFSLKLYSQDFQAWFHVIIQDECAINSHSDPIKQNEIIIDLHSHKKN